MSKHKKTHKEKVIADHRHNIYVLKTQNISRNNFISTSADKETFNSDHLYSNAHILNDVIKTGVLTFSIVVAQITLFILLKEHIIMLPNINY